MILKEEKALFVWIWSCLRVFFIYYNCQNQGQKSQNRKQQKSIKEANEIQQKVFNSSELENIHQWLDDNFDHLAHMNDFKLVLFPFKLLDKLFV